jgi:hypothetical protein
LNYQVESFPSDQVFHRRFRFSIGFAYSNSIRGDRLHRVFL